LNIFCVVVIPNGNLFWKYFVCISLIKNFFQTNHAILFFFHNKQTMSLSQSHTRVYMYRHSEQL